MFFDLIQKSLPANLALVDVVSDLLGIGSDASYRRIRGDKPISFEEAIKLSTHFRISMDELSNVVTDKNFIRCRYSPLNLENMADYLAYIQTISNNTEGIRKLPENEIIISATDIPIFSILMHKELSYFRIFSWSKSVYGYTGSFEDYCKELDHTTSILSHLKNIEKNYLCIPSTELWTANTIDSTLKLLDFHSDMNHFHKKETPLLLCEQLLDLMNTTQYYAEKGTKGQNETPFNLYISEAEIGTTFLIFKSAQSKTINVKLYTINSLAVSDERFCLETENWLLNLIQRSTLISRSSEKERYKFFQTQKQKIQFLIDKIVTTQQNSVN
jgi:hypothetical protein